MSQETVVAWSESRPPQEHYVMASYRVMEPLRLFKTCRRGCCVDSGLASQLLPRYWRDATREEIDACWWTKPNAVPPIDIESLY